MQRNYLCALLLLIQCLASLAAPTPKTSTATDEARERLALEARAETERLLNTLFRSQIDYFSRVKTKLGPQTKRARDIDAYIARLNEAIAVKDIAQKDQMWLNIFQEFNKSPLLLNKKSETDLSNDEFANLLLDSNLQEITSKFLTDLGDYFVKMARASTNAVEVAISEYMKNKREALFNFIK
ncbi:uncharacterized protein LOC115626182 [Scaptodrosophila lebanonensis]|uniref:Uncharacterized protein LOC115626182 n=1 Tax=Drosophila lebanonensis TaxID=7225 RepID=A0A6J2TMR4_DROLE|nr:uncharacterized protein LOC115626182 [Scaptodrosophila lebanonensis]